MNFLLVLIGLSVPNFVYSFLINRGIFNPGKIVCTITDRDIDEASGLAASRKHPGVLYTHNDKGGSSRLFALSANDGRLLGELHISPGSNYDWEDVAAGICPGNANKLCIYIGETGDHAGDGSKKLIYVIEEPEQIRNETLHPTHTLHYQWNVLDTETLMVAPNGDVILVSKVHGGIGQVGKIPASAFLGSSTYTISESSTLRIPETTHNDPTGGDISLNGNEVLLRTHENIYYWSVHNMTYLQTMSTKYPTEIPSERLHQPEAVAFDNQGVNFFTCSEGRHQPIYKFTRI